jgi:hypothetical protein
MPISNRTGVRIATLLLLGGQILFAAKPSSNEREALRDALQKEDAAAIEALVASSIIRLGPRAGTPEQKDTFQPVSSDAKPLSKEEAFAAFEPFFVKLGSWLPWRPETRPEDMTVPLRAAASVLSGANASLRSGYDTKSVRKSAAAAAEFLMRAQKECGADCYPFPAAKGTSNARAMEVASDFIAKAERNGSISQIVRNGWVFEDLGDGGLQFDNGECGVAMWDWFLTSGDAQAEKSARRASEWALGRPLVPNWNYNSFSVFLLARAYNITGDERFRAGALRKATLGVLPGQLKHGVHAGRWVDQHNARPAYHYIMVRALAELTAVLKENDREAPAIRSGLRMALSTRNQEIIEKGVMNKDKAFEALLLTANYFSDTPDIWTGTNSQKAFHLLGAFISEEYRGGKFPLSPGEWCRFLEYFSSGRTTLP